MPATSDLFYVYDSGSSPYDEFVDYISAPGNTSGSNTVHNEAADKNTNNTIFQGLAVGDGLYFISALDENTNSSYIYEEQLGQTPAFSTQHLVGGGPVATGIYDDVTSLALNPSDDILYFASRNGFYEEKFSQPNFTGNATKTELASLPAFTSDAPNTAQQPLAFDQADHTAYFAQPSFYLSSFFTSNNKVDSNYLYVISGVDKNATGNLSYTKVDLGSSDGSLPFKDGVINAIALDSANDTLIIATRAIPDPNNDTTDDGIYTYNIQTKQLTTLFQQKDTGSTHPSSLTDMSYITVDPVTGYYYVTDGLQSNTAGAVFQGQVGVAGKPQEISGLATGGNDALGLAIVDPPTLSVTPVTTDAVQGGAALTLLTSDTIIDPEGQGTLSKATISIANSQTNDELSIPGISGGKVDGVTVSGNDSATLTLSGAASIATYESLLAEVTYQDAGTDNSTQAHPTRTIDWTVDDGLLTSNIATSTVTINRPPSVSASGTVTYHGEQSSPTTVTLDPTLTVTDLDGVNITGATVTIAGSPGYISGDTLSFTQEFGITGTQTNGQLSLSGSASAADYTAVLDSVTYGFTPASGDPTNSGADTNRTIDWAVTDADGLTSSPVAASTLNVAPCYCRGARILTDRGEVAVEALHIGDLAITASGARRPIVWLGHRRLDLTRHNNPTAVWPVRVAANAFGEGLPHRDLWLSPGHNVVSQGVLMPISSLINGRSVAQIKQNAVEYWHVELDAHDILLAEGLPAESYLDCGNRAAFANGGAFIEAHPDFAPKYWGETCLPLVKQGPAVTATKARLLASLAAAGHHLVREADAHILVDGRRIEPSLASETRLSFTLPAGGQKLVLRSNVFVPAHVIAENADSRELGICVTQLKIDGAAVGLDCDESCATGWREAEFVDGQFARRWTTGATPMPAGAQFIELDLAGVGYYWRAPSERPATHAA